MTWRLHIETIEAFITFIRLYSLLKSKRLSVNIKLNLHEALFRSVMTFACPAWEFAAETYLLKLQHLQNSGLRTKGNLPRCTLVRVMHVAFQIPYVYDYITKLCRRQAEINNNNNNKSFTIMKMKIYAILDKSKPHTENIRGLNLAAVIYTTVQVSRLMR
jgi:hypothetical protein